MLKKYINQFTNVKSDDKNKEKEGKLNAKQNRSISFNNFIDSAMSLNVLCRQCYNYAKI